MANIKSYKDGDRLILVLEDCTGERAKKVNDFILDILGMPAEPVSVPGVDALPHFDDHPPKPEEAEEIHTPKPFKEPVDDATALTCATNNGTSTLRESVEAGDTPAVIEMCFRAKSFDKPIRESIQKICKDYIAEDCKSRNPNSDGRADIQKFMMDYQPIAKGAIKEILEKAGYSEIQYFCKFSGMTVLKSAYKALINCLLNAVNR